VSYRLLLLPVAHTAAVETADNDLRGTFTVLNLSLLCGRIRRILEQAGPGVTRAVTGHATQTRPTKRRPTQQQFAVNAT